MSNSEASTHSDSDITLPPSDCDARCDSPDLFDDPPTNYSRKSFEGRESGATKNKRQSNVHDMSDSESDSEVGEIKHGVSGGNEVSSSRKKFINDFLNMTDTDSESERRSRTKGERDNRKLDQRNVVASPVKQDKPQTDQHHYSQKTHKKNYSRPFLSTTENKPDKTESLSAGGANKNGKESKYDNSSHSQQGKTQNTDHRHKKYSEQHSLKRKHSDESIKHSKGSDKGRKSSEIHLSHSKTPVPEGLRKAVTEILHGTAGKKSDLLAKSPCQYGSKCYRKNPSHFAEFSHPGDADINETDNLPPPKKKSRLINDVEKPSTSKLSSEKESPVNIGGKQRSKSPTVPKIKASSISPISTAKVKDTSGSPFSTSKVKAKPDSPPTSKSVEYQRSRTKIKNPRNAREKFEQAQPYSFFLTKVAGIDDKYNSAFVMDIKDILSEDMGNLTASCQLNFMFDIPWLMKNYPPCFRKKPVLIVHGEQGPSKNSLQAQAMQYDNIRFCQARLEMMYGTHHTKMMLLLYEEGLRVVIHTSNLIEHDWHQKTQGIWISPIFPRLSSPSREEGESPTHFKKDLLDYLAAYKAYQLKEWSDHIAHHDMSKARVFLISSVPGRHVGDKQKSMWGHLKLRRILQQHGPNQGTVKSWPVVGQFSSIGSMGPNKDNWLCGEWLQSLSATKAGSGMASNARLQLVFPSKDNVRLSLEGFPAGGSIPYSVNTAKKQTYLHDFFHVWKSEGRGRSRAMPHIKTYIRPAQEGSKAAWFAVTSANLSKAAWGALEKKGAQLMIRSYEIGVLYLPSFFSMGKEDVFHCTNDASTAVEEGKFLLPYDLPTTIYDKRDRPWMWDIPYMDLPDTNGNVWCPFSK